MLSDAQICKVFGAAQYRMVNGKAELIPIDECPDYSLRNAKKACRKQFIQDMRWVGRRIARQQAIWNGENIIIVVIPLKEWHEIVRDYPTIYTSMTKGGGIKC